nr:hypothetical protein Iba_chr14bCG10100 [Ipomoea batatas]
MMRIGGKGRCVAHGRSLRRYSSDSSPPPSPLLHADRSLLPQPRTTAESQGAAPTLLHRRAPPPESAHNVAAGDQRRRPPWPSPLPSPSGERRRELQVATSATFAGEGTRRHLRKLASRLLLYHRRKGEELTDIEAPTPETAIATVRCCRLTLPNSDVDQEKRGREEATSRCCRR